MTSEQRNVFARIAAAYKEISAEVFEKTGTVAGSGGGYKFIPIGQILEIVRKANGNNGVIVIFGKPEYDADQGEGRTKYDKANNYGGTTTWHYAVGHITVRIFGESSDDRIEMEVPFEAQDNSDKLTNKIMTNAERCLYRTLYAIDEGGDDPESINETMSNIVDDAKPKKSKTTVNQTSKPEHTEDVPNFQPASEISSETPERKTMINALIAAEHEKSTSVKCKKIKTDFAVSTWSMLDDAMLKAAYEAIQ
jgi:hypothetical protein